MAASPSTSSSSPKLLKAFSENGFGRRLNWSKSPPIPSSMNEGSVLEQSKPRQTSSTQSPAPGRFSLSLDALAPINRPMPSSNSHINTPNASSGILGRSLSLAKFGKPKGDQKAEDSNGPGSPSPSTAPPWGDAAPIPKLEPISPIFPILNTRTNASIAGQSVSSKGSANSQKVRVVGRGGRGSRPRPTKEGDTLSPTTSRSVSSREDTQLRNSELESLSSSTKSDGKPIVRVVGRGGSGSKYRSLSVSSPMTSIPPSFPFETVDVPETEQQLSPIASVQSNGATSSPSSPSSIHSNPPAREHSQASLPSIAENVAAKPQKVRVGGGRGGAGSKPRLVKKPKGVNGPLTSPTSDINVRVKWFSKSKKNSSPAQSSPPTTPLRDSMESSMSSIHFLQPPLPRPPPPPAAPSIDDDVSVKPLGLFTIPPLSLDTSIDGDSYPPTPSLISASSLTEMSSISNHQQSALSSPSGGPSKRKLSKLERTLGSRLPELTSDFGPSFSNMAIRQPTLPTLNAMPELEKAAPDDDDEDTEEDLDALAAAIRIPDNTMDVYPDMIVSMESNVEVYADDAYDSSSICTERTPTSPIMFLKFDDPGRVTPVVHDDDDRSIMTIPAALRHHLVDDEEDQYYLKAMPPASPLFFTRDQDRPFANITSLYAHQESSLHPNYGASKDTGWTGQWNRSDIIEVVSALRELR